MLIALKIEFGIDHELKRVNYTLAKLDWFESQGYKVRLPEGIIKESSVDDIQRQIVKEFDEKRYKEVADQINADFATASIQLSKTLREVFGKDIPKTFCVYLTNYGVGGSYNLPNTVIFNINNTRGYKTIIHEIIHLLIENQIKKYNVQHWEKERIVDLILNSKELSFLGYNDWQTSYGDAEQYIDQLFSSYFFKDPKNFFSKIENARISA